MTRAATANPLRPLARAKRLSMREQWVRAFFAAVDRADSTYEAVAEACGRTPQKVRAWASLDESAPLPSVLDLWSMPPAVRAELRAFEAMRDLHVVLPAAPDTLSHPERAALLARECTDPIRQYLAALADGHLSAAERADVCRELRELIAVAGSALCALEHEARTGSDGQ